MHSSKFLFCPPRSRTINCKYFMLYSYSLISIPTRHTKVICSLVGWGGRLRGRRTSVAYVRLSHAELTSVSPHTNRSGEFRLDSLNYYFCSFVDTLSTSHHRPWCTVNCKDLKGINCDENE